MSHDLSSAALSQVPLAGDPVGRYELLVASETGYVHGEPFVEPSVLTSSWQSPSGAIGHLFVNPTDSSHTVTIQIDTRNVPDSVNHDVAVYSSAGTDGFAPLWKNAQLPRDFSAEIAPLQLLSIQVHANTD